MVQQLTSAANRLASWRETASFYYASDVVHSGKPGRNRLEPNEDHRTRLQDGGRSGVVNVLTCWTSRAFQISLSNVTLLKVGTSLKLKFFIFVTPCKPEKRK